MILSVLPGIVFHEKKITISGFGRVEVEWELESGLINFTPSEYNKTAPFHSVTHPILERD